MGSSSNMGSAAPSSILLESCRRLVLRLAPHAAGTAQETRLLQLSLRLLGSRLAAGSVVDELVVTEKMKKQASLQKDSRASLQLQDYLGRLKQKSVLTRRLQVLCVLANLSFSPDSASASCVAPEPAAALPPVTSSSLRYISFTLPAAPSSLQRVDAAPRTDITVAPTPAPRPHKEAFTDSVSETALLRDCLFVMHGIDGQIIKFEEKSSGSYEINIKASLPTPIRGLVLRICEAGWLFRRVSQFSKSRSAVATGGLVLQGFISGIQDELSEYYRLVAILQSQIGNDVSAGDLTLRKLSVWTQEPVQRLKLMALLCHAAQGKKGGELVSALAAHVRHGDSLVNSLCRKLLRPACAPLLQMIRLWVEDGELWDPHDEFFVGCDFSLDDRRWKEKYSLRAAMVPSMLSSELARLVLIAGKSINFIRRCCGEVAYAPSVKLPELSQLDIDDVEALMYAVEAVAKSVNMELANIIVQRFKFMEHCFSVQRFILLGQGDFARILMEMLGEELSKPAHAAMRHNITGIVEAALRTSASAGEDTVYRDRVHVALMEESSQDQGWGVFALEYRVDGPLVAILDSSSHKMYKKMFYFLWKFRRVEHTLTQSWRNLMSLSHISKKTAVAPELARAYTVRAEMANLVANFQYYIMFEVLAACWSQFTAAVKTSVDLDGIVAAHEEYVRNLVEKALLGSSTERIALLISRLLNTVLEYCHGCDRLVQWAVSEAARSQRLQAENASRERAGKWAAVPGEVPPAAAAVPYQEGARMQRLATEFASQFDDLRALLCDSKADSSTDSLRSLVFRLDFSEYYASK